MKRKSLQSIVAYNTGRDRVDLYGRLDGGEQTVVRVLCIDEHTFRILTPDVRGGFDTCGAAQILAAELDGKQGNLACREEGHPLEVQGDLKKLSLTPVKEGDSAQRAAPRLEIEPATATMTFFTPMGEKATTISGVCPELAGGSTRVEGTVVKEEYFYGTGQRFDSVNRRGTSVRIWAVDRWCETAGNSYVPVPFFLSTRGYGLYLNRFESSLFDLAADAPEKWQIELDDAPLDLYIYLHEHPAEILAAYSDLTGHAPMPPEWAFGVHVCRHLRLGEFKTPEGIHAMMQKMEEHHLPYSSVIIEGWDTYDTDTYQQLRAITNELHEKGKKVMVYEPCGRFPNFGIADKKEANEVQWKQAAASERYMVHNTEGSVDLDEAAAYNPEDAPHHRRSRFLDVTNPEAVAWWRETVWGRLVTDIGIDGAKIDFCEQFPEHGGVTFHDGRGVGGMHHLFPVLYNAMMYRLYQDQRPEGGMCFSRGGGIGAQRYPFMWCGDQLREWRFLGAIVNALVSSGLSGIPFMSHDLAAYMPTKNPKENVEREVFIRGTEFGCFTGNMETHGIVTRPYDFDDETVALYRLYSKIHYALIPYLKEQAETSCRTGAPLLRHLYLAYPNDPRVRGIEDQYLLGDDLLVAPVLTAATARSIYFPAGTWECMYSSESIEGPKEESAWSAPLARIPVFLRREGGSRTIAEALREIRALLAEAGV